MKTLLKTALGALICTLALDAKEGLSLGNEVKGYDKIFDRIAERRSGADVIAIDKLENPFVNALPDFENVDSNGTVQPIVYTLEATFEQKAKINGNWYKKNDNVDSFKLIKVTHNSVTLQNEIEKKELVIRTKDESNVKIFSK